MILDSRGFPTVEVEIPSEHGMIRAACPSGASTGEYEALELRDGDASAFEGKGVSKALAHIRDEIFPALRKMTFANQKELDAFLEKLDGSADRRFKRLGANAVLPVSMAYALKWAHQLAPCPEHFCEGLSRMIKTVYGQNITPRLPVPCMNVINGGRHAGNQLGPQEYMIAPHRATSMLEAIRMCSEVYAQIKKILKTRYGLAATAVGDEGGFAPPLSKMEEPLAVITEAIAAAGYTGKMGICMDVAASEMYDAKVQKYDLNFKGSERCYLTTQEITDAYMDLLKRYPILSIEDPYDENDFTGFAALCALVKDLPHKPQIVGDDLTVSQVSRIAQAVEQKACTSLLLKINQVGTISGALESAFAAFNAGWSVMTSHRSGETEDVFIAGLSVAIGCGQIKTGAPARSERCAKYNELLRIAEKYPNMPYGYPGWK